MVRLTLIYFVLFLFGTLGIGYSQTYRIELPVGYNKIYVSDMLPGVDGSPYLWDGWVTGSVIFRNGKSIDSLSLRYNVHKGEMQFQTNNKIYIIGVPDSLNSVNIAQRTFVYSAFDDKGKYNRSYFEVISKGKAQIFVRHLVQIRKSNYNAILNAGEKNDQLEHKEAYYIKKEYSVVLIDKKGKNLLQLLSDKSEEVSGFVKKNHISYTDKNELCRIADYYNSL